MGEDGIARALQLIVAGERDAGIAMYCRVLKKEALPSVPVGLHTTFLQRAGREDDAAALRAGALSEGADVLLRAADGSSADVLAGYEQLLTDRAFNARMVWEYLLLLSEAGRAAEVARMLDPSMLLRRCTIDVDPDDVAAFLLKRETLGVFQERVQSVRRMTNLTGLHRLKEPVATRLVAALRSEAETYLRDWRFSDHPLAGLLPTEFRLRAWALISRGEGFNAPHIHHTGWVTGVYYPADVQADLPGGELRVGAPPSLSASATRGWPDIAIKPSRGLLVLMPSFYTHWTVALGRPGLRMSVAFDMT